MHAWSLETIGKDGDGSGKGGMFDMGYIILEDGKESASTSFSFSTMNTLGGGKRQGRLKL